jgi:hypothetical protein
MAFCSSCGNELKDGVRFCASCGQAIPTAVAQAVPAAPGPGAAPQAPPAIPPAYAQGAYPPPPPPPPPGARRSLKWVWIGGGAAAAIIIAVVLVLVLVVFNGENGDTAGVTTTVSGQTGASGGSGASGQPGAKGDSKAVEQVVRNLFKAMEDRDVDLLVELMDPSIIKALPEGDARDAYRMALKSGIEALGKMKFSGIEMKVEITSPTTAKVTLTAGKATITDASGNTTTEEITDTSDTSMEFTKIDGKWYMATGSGPFM